MNLPNVHNIDLSHFRMTLKILILNFDIVKRFLILTEFGKLGKLA